MHFHAVPVSSENQAFQHAEVLKRNRNKRAKYGEFFVEGAKSITAAVDHDWDITALYFCAESELSDWANEIIHRSRAKQLYALAPELMQKLSEKEETSELLATMAIPPDDLSRIAVHSAMRVVVLDRPASPGNLGTSIRSCDAFGIDGVVISGHAADVYHPQAVRGSMGALFAKPVVRLPSQKELFDWISEIQSEELPVTVVGTSAHADQSVADFHPDGAVVLVMGNETRGMSRGYQERCDTTVGIPLAGYGSSLNVSCALTAMLYALQA